MLIIPDARKKGQILSSTAHSASEWAIIIISKINEPYLQGWAASIIAWDIAKDEELAEEAFKALDSLIAKYEPDPSERSSYGYDDDLVVDALNKIGYEKAELRCTVKSSVDTGAQVLGPRKSITRTWSSKLNPTQRNAYHV
jgi:hypothetical protein